MESFLESIQVIDPVFLNVYTQILRYLAPILAVLLVIRCTCSLTFFQCEPETWAWLILPDKRRLPITHWESVIGRSKRSDVIIDLTTVSRSHAVLTRYDDGSWTIADAGSKTGVFVNGKQVKIAPLGQKDVIELGGLKMKLMPVSHSQEQTFAKLRTKASPFSNIANVMLLTALQLLICVAYLPVVDVAYTRSVFFGFMGIIVCQWALLIFYLLIRKNSFELETIAFFLCTMGMAAIAAVKPAEALKQLLALGLGLIVFLGVGWSLRDLQRVKKLHYFAAIAGIGFLLITLLFGTEYHGAKNWLMIGGMSVQLSELSKVCFVFVGASTMDRIVVKRNLILFIAYSVAICACLAMMNDFGTALIFFVAFLVIAYMRSGNVGTLALACTSLGFAGVIALKIAPHALQRFTVWRHIWEDPYGAGYQQTRALMCIASGGLFGLGAGQGWLNHVFAADSDIVFATLTEEWGLVMSLLTVVAMLAIGLFAVRSVAMQRSSFYAIAGCTAASILLVQTIFNVLGTVDVLPLTGVTFPFVSNGGSSMIGVWGLLAFVKAADTRQNASFAVRQSQWGRLQIDE